MIDEITLKIHADDLILMALKEDVTNEDVSTACVLPAYAEGEADLIAKEEGVIAGLFVFGRVFSLLSDRLTGVNYPDFCLYIYDMTTWQVAD